MEGGGFLIRKETMIVKNNRCIDEVYNREAKVTQHYIHPSSLT